MQLTKDNLTFLTDLRENNNRDWFNDNKLSFEKNQKEFKSFHSELKKMMDTHDQLDKSKVYRIYRDVRFSKDKTPYKTHWSGSFGRATHHLRGGYYYQVESGKNFAAGGFFGPNSQDLLHLRKQISQFSDPLRAVLASESFKKHFGNLDGEKVKTTPKGFDKEDPEIDLLRHKQFLVYRHFSDEEVLGENFKDLLNDTFKAMRPFFDVMSDYLITDLNGEELKFE